MTDNHEPEHRAADPINDGEDPVIGDAPPRAHTLFSNGVYDKLKFLALVLLPALGAAYFSLAPLWELPKADEVVGTIVVVDTFLGVLLGVTTRNYNNSDARFDGVIDVHPDYEAGETTMNVSLDPQAVANKDEVVVKVQKL